MSEPNSESKSNRRQSERKKTPSWRAKEAKEAAEAAEAAKAAKAAKAKATEAAQAKAEAARDKKARRDKKRSNTERDDGKSGSTPEAKRNPNKAPELGDDDFEFKDNYSSDDDGSPDLFPVVASGVADPEYNGLLEDFAPMTSPEARKTLEELETPDQEDQAVGTLSPLSKEEPPDDELYGLLEDLEINKQSDSEGEGQESEGEEFDPYDASSLRLRF